MKILITGSNGLLGQKIVAQLSNRGITYLATSQGQNRNSACPKENYQALDITDKISVNKTVKDFDPTAIINTAAMTNVDSCENDEDNCRKLNVDALETLLKCSSENDIQLVHLSTDFVFDGENGPYIEDDNRNPLSIYAKSKKDSEDLLMNSDYKNWSILRTIIVFGTGENLSRSNIVLWARESLKKGEKLRIVNDQYRAPTWADDLAWACIETCLQNQKGIFHISGPEIFSIYDLVKKIALFYACDTSLVEAISSDSLNQKAKRPAKTGFILKKAQEKLGYQPMKLEDCLKSLEIDLR